MYYISDNVTPSAGPGETPFYTHDVEAARNRLKMLISDARAGGWLLHADGNADIFIGHRNGQSGMICIKFVEQ